MNPVIAQWNVTLAFAVVLIAGLSGSVVHAQPQSTATKTNSCTAPEYRSFDFWVGNWDAFDVDNPSKKVAHNRVDRILDGCVLLEDYESTASTVRVSPFTTRLERYGTRPGSQIKECCSSSKVECTVTKSF